MDRKKKINIGLIVLAFLLLLLGGMYWFPKIKEREQEKQSSNLNEEVTNQKAITPNKIFYVKDENIFSYDIVTKEIEQWTSFPDDSHSIITLNVIDEETLGFSRGYAFDDTVYTINLRTKNITKRKSFVEGEQFDHYMDFATENKFAYSYSTEDNKWHLSLYDGGIIKSLEESTTMMGFGRGDVPEDSNKIAFSPNKKYFLHIGTSSIPARGDDFNIYVYNLEEGRKDIIRDATQPQWLDNDSIVYRKPVKNYNEYTTENQGGLYVYNVMGGFEKIPDIVNSAYEPNVLYGAKKIVYQVDPKPGALVSPDLLEIWLLDYESGENRKIADSAEDAVWVNESNILFTNIEKCDDCYRAIDISGMSLFNLEDNTTTLIPELKDVSLITTEYK